MKIVIRCLAQQIQKLCGKYRLGVEYGIYRTDLAGVHRRWCLGRHSKHVPHDALAPERHWNTDPLCTRAHEIAGYTVRKRSPDRQRNGDLSVLSVLSLEPRGARPCSSWLDMGCEQL